MMMTRTIAHFVTRVTLNCFFVIQTVFCHISISLVNLRISAKSAGPNGLMAEPFCHSGVKLWTHLSLVSTFCMRHGYLPSEFMNINIIPLVKNKCCDLTNMNNYYAIVLYNIRYKGHSTTPRTGIVKQ